MDPIEIKIRPQFAHGAGDPEQVPARIGDGLQVHTVSFVLPRVKGPVQAVPVGADQGAVENHESSAAAVRGSQGGSDARGAGGEAGDGLVGAPPGGGRGDCEAGGYVAQALPFTEVGQDE
jgi:hypothetical protein